eukprot:scaffold20105_cov98-Isochrysis_galbana.AAC.1
MVKASVPRKRRLGAETTKVSQLAQTTQKGLASMARQRRPDNAAQVQTKTGKGNIQHMTKRVNHDAQTTPPRFKSKAVKTGRSV